VPVTILWHYIFFPIPRLKLKTMKIYFWRMKDRREKKGGKGEEGGTPIPQARPYGPN
jgi:hypothetical protein